MKNFTRLGHVDASPILKELQDDHWKEDTYLRDYPQGPFGDTESVILRFPPRSVHETEEALAKHLEGFDQHENVWQPISKEFPIAKSMALDLMRRVGGTRLGRVMINKINPGGRIYRHADTPVHAQYWSRYHIVLYALPGVQFHCEDEIVNMQTNEVWYFRNDLEHEVKNDSGDVRIHMVVDIKDEIVKYVEPKRVIDYGKGYTYQRERLYDIIEDLKPFVPLHWGELGLTKDDVPVDMDWPRYLKLEREGILHLFTVRLDNKIIGYQFSFVSGHFHYKSTKHANVDLYYILPEHRKGRVGIKLFQECEKDLKSLGVKKILTGCKIHLDHSRLFEHLGYTKSDYSFIKILS